MLYISKLKQVKKGHEIMLDKRTAELSLIAVAIEMLFPILVLIF